MEKAKLDRIGELSRKQRAEGLTEEEKQEQEALRKEYIRDIRASLTGILDNTYIQDMDGNKKKVERRPKY